MKKLLVIPKLGFVYRIYVGKRPSNFLIAFRTWNSAIAFWVSKKKQFPYFEKSRFYHYA